MACKNLKYAVLLTCIILNIVSMIWLNKTVERKLQNGIMNNIYHQVNIMKWIDDKTTPDQHDRNNKQTYINMTYRIESSLKACIEFENF